MKFDIGFALSADHEHIVAGVSINSRAIAVAGIDDGVVAVAATQGYRNDHSPAGDNGVIAAAAVSDDAADPGKMLVITKGKDFYLVGTAAGLDDKGLVNGRRGNISQGGPITHVEGQHPVIEFCQCRVFYLASKVGHENGPQREGDGLGKEGIAPQRIFHHPGYLDVDHGQFAAANADCRY